MKKKHRDITVKGVKYAWTIKDDCEYSNVKIWQNKKVIHEELVPAHLIVAPGFIKEVIENL